MTTGEQNGPVQVGLIGYGLAGATFHAPLITTTEGMALAGIVTSQAEKVAADLPDVTVYADAAALLADPAIDLVVIATPNSSHFALAQQALAAGKHVVVDKPFVNHAADADTLIAQAKEAGRLLSVFHNRRWDNDFLTLLHLVEESVLGDVVSYTAHYDRYRPTVRARWREEPGEGSGTLYDLGAHLIDQALALFGTPNTVFANLAAQREGGKTVDFFHLLLNYGELKVVLHSESLAIQPGPYLVVHGTAGSFIKYGMDSQEDGLKAGQRPGAVGWGADDPARYAELTRFVGETAVTERLPTLPGAYERYYAAVRDAITKGTPLPVTADEARDVIRIIELAMQSQREGKALPFGTA